MALHVADGNIVGAVFMEPFLTEEEQQSHLFKQNTILGLKAKALKDYKGPSVIKLTRY